MSDLKDLIVAGAVGYVAYRVVAKLTAPSTAEAAQLARTVAIRPAPVVVAPTVVLDPYPDYWGWGPSVWNWNFGGGRGRRGGGHHGGHHRGGHR